MLFSQRKRLAERADAWCKAHNVDRCTHNIVTALDSFGLLKMDTIVLEDKEPDLCHACKKPRDYNKQSCEHCGDSSPF